MEHKQGKLPINWNFPHPSSQSVITTTMKKTGGKKDNFRTIKRECKDFNGSPGTEFVDSGY